MKVTMRFCATIMAWLLAPYFVAAQDATVTLMLKSGEEIQCRVMDIWKNEIYFDATSPDVTYRFGDRVSIDNVASVKLKDGRLLSVGEFADYREGRRPAAPASQPSTAAPTPAKAEIKTGMRLSPSVLQTETTKSESRIGLRMPEAPRPGGQSIDLEVSQLADLLAELGLGGRVLHETSQGALANRTLTESQLRLVEAIKQSEIWLRRKADFREANQQAFTAFNTQYGRQPDFLRNEFDFEPRDGSTAFLEFVQYLHITAAANVESEWQKVEQLFGRRGAAAVADILNNYDDWYYLYGSELEKR